MKGRLAGEARRAMALLSGVSKSHIRWQAENISVRISSDLDKLAELNKLLYGDIRDVEKFIEDYLELHVEADALSAARAAIDRFFDSYQKLRIVKVEDETYVVPTSFRVSDYLTEDWSELRHLEKRIGIGRALLEQLLDIEVLVDRAAKEFRLVVGDDGISHRRYFYRLSPRLIEKSKRMLSCYRTLPDSTFIEDAILSLMSEGYALGLRDVMKHTEMPKDVCYNALRKLVENGTLTKIGNRNQTVYQLNKKGQ